MNAVIAGSSIFTKSTSAFHTRATSCGGRSKPNPATTHRSYSNENLATPKNYRSLGGSSNCVSWCLLPRATHSRLGSKEATFTSRRAKFRGNGFAGRSSVDGSANGRDRDDDSVHRPDEVQSVTAPQWSHSAQAGSV